MVNNNFLTAGHAGRTIPLCRPLRYAVGGAWECEGPLLTTALAGGGAYVHIWWVYAVEEEEEEEAERVIFLLFPLKGGLRQVGGVIGREEVGYGNCKLHGPSVQASSRVGRS